MLPNKYGILSGKYGIPYCEALRLLLSAGFAATVYFDPRSDPDSGYGCVDFSNISKIDSTIYIYIHSRVSTTIHVHFHKENIPAPPIFDLQA